MIDTVKREANGVFLLSGPRSGPFSDFAAELMQSQREPIRRVIEAQFSGVMATVDTGPTLAEVKANPRLLNNYIATMLSTQDLLERGLGNYHRHVDVLSDVFGKLNDAEIRGVGRWSFQDQTANNTTYVMPAEISGFKGMKVIQSHPGNIEAGLPRSNASVWLFDVQSGLLAAVLAGSLVTPVKTAAQSGIVLRLWCEQHGNPQVNLGVLGGGPVAREHFAAFEMLLGTALQTSVWNSPRQSARAIVEQLRAEAHSSAAVFEENGGVAQWRSNVIVSATTSKTAVVDEQRIAEAKQPTLVFAIGPNDISADALRKAALVVIDDPIGYREQKNAVAEFLRSQPTNVVSLGDVVRNPNILRSAATVVFAPMGVGLSDVALCVDLLGEQPLRKL